MENRRIAGVPLTYGLAMRWDDLFSDLESQLERELGAEELDLLAEEERLRVGRLSMRDRLLAMVDPGRGRETVRFALRDGSLPAVTVTAIGRDWMAGELAAGGTRSSCVIPFPAITGMLPDARQLEHSRQERRPEPAGSLSARLGLTFVLRDLCRRRSGVELHASAGRWHGTIDRVGRDHLDLAEHDPDLPRRTAAVDRVRIVPLAELVLVAF